MKRVSLKDVAVAAGCSLSTVSLALRDSPHVAAETKRRIQAAAEEMSYRPSLVARRLSSRRSGVIGVVLPPVPNDMGIELLLGISEQVSSQGSALLIEYTGASHQREVDAVRRLINEHVDGVLIHSVVVDESVAHLEELQHRGIPLVQVEMRIPGVASDYVASDNRGGAYRITKYLVDRGHRHIGYVSNEPRRNVLAERLEGYRAALAGAGLPVGSDLIAARSWIDPQTFISEMSGRQRVPGGRQPWPAVREALSASKEKALVTIQEWRRRDPPPSAIFVAHLGPLPRVLWALRELGLHIPKDISLVAFDDLPFLPALGIEMTTMIQHEYEIGQEAARLLLDRIEGSTTGDFRSVHFEPELVEGNTVASRS